MWRNRNHCELSLGRWNAAVLWKAVWQLLKHSEIKLPLDPTIPLLGIFQKELRAVTKRYFHTHVRSQKVGETQVSADGETRNGISLGLKKDDFLSHATPRTNPKGTVLSEINTQISKGKSRHASFYCASLYWTLQTTAFVYERQWQPHQANRPAPLCPTACAHFASLCDILVTLTGLKPFASSLLHMLWWSVITDHKSLKAQMTAFFSNKILN